MGRWCEVRCACSNHTPLGNPSEGVYACGHAGGVLVGFSPIHLWEVGWLLVRLAKQEPSLTDTFRVFLRICDGQNYDGDCLVLSEQERDEWELELQELLAIKQGTAFFPYHTGRRWSDHWSDYFSDPWHREAAGSLVEVLRNGVRLCEASRKAGQPVEFFL